VALFQNWAGFSRFRRFRFKLMKLPAKGWEAAGVNERQPAAAAGALQDMLVRGPKSRLVEAGGGLNAEGGRRGGHASMWRAAASNSGGPTGQTGRSPNGGVAGRRRRRLAVAWGVQVDFAPLLHRRSACHARVEQESWVVVRRIAVLCKRQLC
jgi:hypothetical protein